MKGEEGELQSMMNKGELTFLLIEIIYRLIDRRVDGQHCNQFPHLSFQFLLQSFGRGSRLVVVIGCSGRSCNKV